MTWLKFATILLIAFLISNVQADDSEDEYKKAEEKRKRELEQKEQISIIAPRYLRPHSNYNVIVQLNNTKVPARVDLIIIGGQDSNQVTHPKSIKVEPNEISTVQFQVDDWPKLNYMLNVSVVAIDNSFNFTDSETIAYNAKSYSAFIQTDKAMYKAGQKIQFRVVVVQANLQPLTIKNEIDVKIYDSKQNLVKQWTNQSTYRGLLTLDFPLSEEPNLGDWKIKVTARGQDTEKTISVAEYVLPTFSVDLQIPEHTTYDKSKITATVKATYTYGKPVKGQVILTAQPKERSVYYLDNGSHRKIAQFKAQLNEGAADIPINLMKDLSLQSDKFSREIEFSATVEEELTGLKREASKTIKIHDKPYVIEQILSARTFKPGLNYTILLKVSNHDNEPVPDNGPDLMLSYGMQYNRDSYVFLKPRRGLIVYTMKTPRMLESSYNFGQMVSPNSINMEAAYDGHIYPLEQISAFYSVADSHHHMQISLPELLEKRREALLGNKREDLDKSIVKVNDKLKVKLMATEPMNRVTCQGIARGEIVWAINVAGKNKTEVDFDVAVDGRMAPRAKILCFYVREDGSKEVIADSITFPVLGMVKNDVKVTARKHTLKPGEEAEITVLTKTNAFVGILGIDQSVNLLKSGNDLSTADINSDLASYDDKQQSFHHYYRGSRSNEQKLATEVDNIGIWDLTAWRSESSSSSDVFNDANVIIMTNNLVDRNRYFHPMALQMSLDRAEVQPAASPVSHSFVMKKGYSARIKSEVDVVSEPLVVRQHFPETWLWENATAKDDGTANFKSKVPDTITSWIVSAISMDEASGLGFTGVAKATRINVQKPFFIKMNLPYSIYRGETVSIQAVVHNYLQEPASVVVSLENPNNDFQFTSAANTIEDENYSAETKESKTVDIKSDSSASVSFLITARKLGNIDLKMTAVSPKAGDAVIEKLLVKPEGQVQYRNKAVLINLSGSQTNITKNITIDVPKNAIEGSQKVFVSAIGDLMGTGLTHTEDLLRIPYGCGEQNMINLVPNIQIYKYLNATHRLTDFQKNKAIKNIETGYQRQLRYKRDDGSFSAFGKNDKTGSTWLTAYVLKTLQQASSIVPIDKDVVDMSIKFLTDNSNEDGSIREEGQLFDHSLQSTAAGSNESLAIYMTAYTLTALLQENIRPVEVGVQLNKSVSDVTEKGLKFLEKNIDFAANQKDAHQLSIIAYALTLANRVSSKKVYDLLWSKSQEAEGKVFWLSAKAKNETKADGNEVQPKEELKESTNSTTTKAPTLKPLIAPNKQSEHSFIPDSISVEISALALLTAVAREDFDRALPIVSWLISQQNSNGGFASTQDTVLAIEALAKFGEATYKSGKTQSLDIDIVHPRVDEAKSPIRTNSIDHIAISSANSLLYQKNQLPNATWVQLNVNGSGVAVAHVSWQYNLLVSAEKPAFYLNPQVDKNSTSDQLQLNVCTRYSKGDQSNMAVMEVELPSGYVIDPRVIETLLHQRDVKRVDREDGDSKLVIYFDKVTKSDICLTIPAFRKNKVSNRKPVPVSIYDYYDRRQVARIFYDAPATNSCDICESDCPKSCVSQKRKVRDVNNKQLNVATDKPVYRQTKVGRISEQDIPLRLHNLQSSSSGMFDISTLSISLMFLAICLGVMLNIS